MDTEDINYQELSEKLAKQVENLNIKLFARSQRTPVTAIVKDVYGWFTEHPIRLVYALSIFYMTSVWLHSHYNMFTEHKHNMM